MKANVKTNAVRILERLGIRHEVRTYVMDESDLSAEAAAVKLGLPLEQVFKTLVARTDRNDVVMVCIPATSELDLKALGATAGAKRSDLVPIKDIQGLTGYVRGGVSPLGSRKTYPIVLDASVVEQPTVSISAGRRGVQILLSPEDLIRATSARVSSITRHQR